MDRENPGAALIHFKAQLHGDEDQIHSTRGELFGLLACMQHIYYIKQKFKIRMKTKVRIFIYPDSESSISIATQKFNDSDIKSEVRYHFHKMKNFIDIKFVRSHQDDQKLFSQLSLASRLNVLMDKFAKEALDPLSQPSIIHRNMIPHLPQQQNSFHNDFYRLTRNTLNELRR